MMDIVPFRFQGITLQEACWMDGKPFFTRRAVGEWLEYSQPDSAIKHIVTRNPHIEDDRWSTLVKLTSVEGDRDVLRELRVYDPIGFQLIVFESRQPRAIKYKIAVANLAWAFMNGSIKPSEWSSKGDLISSSRQIHSLKPCIKRGELVRDLAQREGISKQTAYRMIGRVTGKRMRQSIRCDRGKTRYPKEQAQVFHYIKRHPKAGGTEIRNALGLTVSATLINAWLRNKHKINP
ncbi:hypothetical protein DO021_21805 [Desulfobacter hydrogenophilus]|uniref:Bro-N domain-containing protein n=1 Tax=Desulfobacter hydrogenophilus TaxID=2291 RepID=A0A328FA16_9BACT|nr:hypothetical protein [Desulfobacter hydrogenophilus]NDY74619.1 hypothetical protein [Desulfobacter hydrogenophilus]QBH14287.1 hypothetical protein EYB58_16015 [Desulfobacter hydrogenophilus]RAL99922.1 hypothetical protein DO021_21805 [Desulfobacter hydrogenophilus]